MLESPEAAAGLSPKTRILDAAEEVFSIKGYHGGSIREITAKANVDLGLANYHFGSKENLFRHVIERRAVQHCVDFNRELDRVIEEAGDAPPTIEAIIRAYCVPMFERMMRGGPGWKNYLKLLAQIATSQRNEAFLSPYNEQYDPVVDKYVAAMQRALPGADARHLYYAVYFVQAAYVYILAETGSIDRISGGMVTAADFDAIADHFVPFFSAGTRALAAKES